MKILILGGTVFLGRHLVDAALGRGHEVTIFHRGVHEAGFAGAVEDLRGDRRGDLTALQGRSWDVVIDTSGFLPDLVRDSAQLLAAAVKQYIFISSISVYADFRELDLDETAPVGRLSEAQLEEVRHLLSLPDPIPARIYGEMYGPLKALCEEVVSEILPGRALIIRPGLIVGPDDASDRFTYWPSRVARGGEILAPGRPERAIQLIDVRDLASWIIHMSEIGRNGTYNATGPAATLTMRELLETCQQVAGSGASFTWLDEDFLLEQGAVPWTQLPLWVPETEEEDRGFLATSIRKALAAGLTFRPLAETVRATLAWDAQRDPALERRAGLPAERERELLQAWHSRRA